MKQKSAKVMRKQLGKWAAYMDETLDGFEIAQSDIVLPLVDEPQTPPPRIHASALMDTPRRPSASLHGNCVFRGACTRATQMRDFSMMCCRSNSHRNKKKVLMHAEAFSSA